MKQFRTAFSIFLFFLSPFGMWAGESFKFVFGKEPLVYSLCRTTETKTYLSNPSATTDPYANNSRQAMTKATAETRIKFRLTGVTTNKNGVMSVHYEPFDFKSDLDATGPAGHFITTVHGLSVKSSQNGITIIDTDNEIGMSQAATFKEGAIPTLLSGSFDVDDAGVIKDIHGDLPFVDFWKQQMKEQIGLFNFEFPSHAVTNGETWQVVIPVSSSGGFKFEGAPLEHTNTFTLMDDDPSLATFRLSAPMHCYDLGGSVEERGQTMHADLSEMEITAHNVIHFDRKRRVLVDEDFTKSIYTTMTVLVQGRAVSSRIESRTEVQVNLIPPGELNNDDQADTPTKRKTL